MVKEKNRNSLISSCTEVALDGKAVTLDKDASEGLTDRPFGCSKCGKTYKRRDHLNRHFKLSCRGEISPKPEKRKNKSMETLSPPDLGSPTVMEQIFACAKCGDKFYNETESKSHANTIGCIDANDFFVSLGLLSWQQYTQSVSANVYRRTTRRSLRKSC